MINKHLRYFLLVSTSILGFPAAFLSADEQPVKPKPPYVGVVVIDRVNRKIYVAEGYDGNWAEENSAEGKARRACIKGAKDKYDCVSANMNRDSYNPEAQHDSFVSCPSNTFIAIARAIIDDKYYTNYSCGRTPEDAWVRAKAACEREMGVAECQPALNKAYYVLASPWFNIDFNKLRNAAHP